MTKKENTIEYYISKYGNELGSKKYEDYIYQRSRKKNNKPFTLKKETKNYTEQDIINGDAIKCKACGFISLRLQWTHFKYKCVPNINSSDEYLRQFPNSELVAINLRKENAITLKNFIKKYGEENGKARWKSYCDKQSYTNSLEYKQKKYGWSIDEFNAYNSSRAVTLNNLVKKHGETHGLEIWERYCDRQRYTTTLEYFIEKYGEIEGEERFNIFDQSRAISSCGVAGKSKLESNVFNTLLPILQDLKSAVSIKDGYSGPFDMGSEQKKKLIEVYGTYWHQDPRLYKATDTLKKQGKPAELIWECDQQKRNRATKSGYEVFVIWEYDWHKTQSKIIKEVKEWWYNGNKTG